MIKVIWRDISGLPQAWMTADELLKEAQDSYDSYCTTIGYLVGETDNFIVVAGTHDGEDKYNDSSMIIRANIVEIIEY